MAHTYTPGLKVSEKYLVRKRRILPLKGEVLVEQGQIVAPDDVVARTELPGDAELINVANMLNVEADELPEKMIKKEGDSVEEGELIATSKSFFGLFKSHARSKMSGTIEKINTVTGQVLLRGPSIPVEVLAYTSGKVVEVVEQEGCVVETWATFVQGIFGIGGETHGELALACQSPSQQLTPKLITEEMAGKVIIGGNRVTAEALKRAIDIGVRGVVAGGFDDQDLRDFLGYDLGVAITGSEKLGVTLIVTEGFGDIDMAGKTYELLASKVGRLACINGATQIRAGVIRPELILPMDRVPTAEEEAAAAQKEIGGLVAGSLIRIIRAPYFGRIGTVSALPSGPHVLESGSKARVLEVDFDGEKAIVPRANVELIES
ncbi:MAG: hypothetical protein P9L99_15505 [Candidatus Lernaella stagnicola]|nr:hypothetical protein [Candidatus Lernaella stagnicola]